MADCHYTGPLGKDLTRMISWREQQMSARFYSEAREALERGDMQVAAERQEAARFRSMSARGNLMGVLDG